MRVAEQLHQFMHAVELEKAMRVIYVPLHAEVNPAINPV